MSPLIMIAATVLPEILKRLAADRSGILEKKIEQTVTSVTGASTAIDAKRVLDQSPQISEQLRARLAEIDLETHKADLEAEDRAAEADLDYNIMQMNNAENARLMIVQLANSSSPSSYTPPALSYIVVIGFFIVLFGAATGYLTKLNADSLQVVNLLFGALTAAFATVLNFWLGSSFGSRRKDSAAATSEAVQQIKQLGGGAVRPPSAPTGSSQPKTGISEPEKTVESNKHPETGESAENLPEDEHGKEIDESVIKESLSVLPAMPKQVPEGNPVPFAQSRTPVASRVWPVRTKLSSARVVSFQSVNGSMIGAPGRRFLASRNGGARFHVGLDLYAEQNDVVVSCEDGKIVNFYPFYKTSKGDMSYALLIEHHDLVINYGEVAETSRKSYGWSVGDRVRAGQPIGTISGTSMLHFETWRLGTTANARWLPGKARPDALLNPTLYLLEIASPPPSL
jgi:murein DD-endopeptidase MepM/ murein hydrolase activator NlpD